VLDLIKFMSSIQHGFDLLIALAVIASVNLWVICATCYLSYSQFLLCVKWQARAEIDKTIYLSKNEPCSSSSRDQSESVKSI
jgi:hypothetical protein